MIIHGPKTLKAWLRIKNENSSSYLRDLERQYSEIEEQELEEKMNEEEKEKERS